MFPCRNAGCNIWTLLDSTSLRCCCGGWICLLALGSISPVLALDSGMLPTEPPPRCCARTPCPRTSLRGFPKPPVTTGWLFVVQTQGYISQVPAPQSHSRITLHFPSKSQQSQSDAVVLGQLPSAGDASSVPHGPAPLMPQPCSGCWQVVSGETSLTSPDRCKIRGVAILVTCCWLWIRAGRCPFLRPCSQRLLLVVECRRWGFFMLT